MISAVNQLQNSNQEIDLFFEKLHQHPFPGVNGIAFQYKTPGHFIRSKALSNNSLRSFDTCIEILNRASTIYRENIHNYSTSDKHRYEARLLRKTRQSVKYAESHSISIEAELSAVLDKIWGKNTSSIFKGVQSRIQDICTQPEIKKQLIQDARLEQVSNREKRDRVNQALAFLKSPAFIQYQEDANRWI